MYIYIYIQTQATRQLPVRPSTDIREDSSLDSQRISNELPSSHLQLISEQQEIIMWEIIKL